MTRIELELKAEQYKKGVIGLGAFMAAVDAYSSARNDTKPVLGEVSFNVVTYSLLDRDVKYRHWSEGLNMIIEKNGVTIKLNSEEIQQIVKSLPRTVDGRY